MVETAAGRLDALQSPPLLRSEHQLLVQNPLLFSDWQHAAPRRNGSAAVYLMQSRVCPFGTRHRCTG